METSSKIKHNRPDLVIVDKVNKTALIVEVGITNIHELARVENEKFTKYNPLADDLQMTWKLKSVKILPVVMTWEALFSKKCNSNLRAIGMNPAEISYIQSRILKRTLETVFLNERREIKLQDETNSPPQKISKD